MNVSPYQPVWLESFLCYLLFDLAMLSIVVFGYFGIKFIAKVVSRSASSRSRFH
jgi:hypothetical protein